MSKWTVRGPFNYEDGEWFIVSDNKFWFWTSDFQEATWLVETLNRGEGVDNRG